MQLHVIETGTFKLVSRNPNGSYSAQAGNDDIMMTVVNSSSFFDTLDFMEIIEEYYDFLDRERQKEMEDILDFDEKGDDSIFDFF